MRKEVLFDWGISTLYGWGVYGKNLALCAVRGTSHYAISIAPTYDKMISLSQSEEKLLAPIWQAGRDFRALVQKVDTKSVRVPRPILHTLSASFETVREELYGKELIGTPSIGVTFFESTARLSRYAASANRRFRGIVAGSTWNANLLMTAGFDQVKLVLQGVDTDVFFPNDRQGRFGDRFVVFSGGKLERRKGQDLVLLAFSRFARRHPDALLVTCWNNLWPQSALDINRNMSLNPLGLAANGELDIDKWILANGVPENQYFNIGFLHNTAMSEVFSEVDVAVFPNRAEGGTNLVAMEAMASGVPVILSANTGHLDIITDDNCYILQSQAASAEEDELGWGESSVDEILELLERAYVERVLSKRLGLQAAKFLRDLSWAKQIPKLLQFVDETIAT